MGEEYLILDIPDYVSVRFLEQIRKRFDIPGKVPDRDLAGALRDDILHRYMDVSRWSEKDMEQIVDGILQGGEQA
jgi:hypothetical protein